MIVFSLEDSGAVEVAKDTLGPVGDIVLGAIFLIVARVLSAERDAILKERRERQTAKGKAGRRGEREGGPSALATGSEPDAAPGRVERFKASLRRDGRRIAIRIATVAGMLLVVRGAITLSA